MEKLPHSKNNQKSDKVVVEGIMSPEEIFERGQLASRNTLEYLKRMYPKTPEYELQERENIANEFLNKELKKLEGENKQKIDSIYAAHGVKQKIKEITNEISSINKKIENERQANDIYLKEQKIKELENIIENYRKEKS